MPPPDPAPARSRAAPSALRGLVLALIAPGELRDPGRLAALGAADWGAVDAIAGQHRLRPLLHFRRADDPAVPQALRDDWRAAHRVAAMDAMIHIAQLGESVRLLEVAGFAPLALKGAWLAQHAYPDPALRPLRDLDLLLTPDTVIPAWQALVAAGYRPAGTIELSLDEIVRLDKHMPPLVTPRGGIIELHQRLWEVDGRMDHAAPSGAAPGAVTLGGSHGEGVRARAVRIGGIAYPAPADMLAHLIVHAAYDHRLDVGPLLLADIAFLLRAAPIDWEAFWTGAKSGGWEAGARLILALVADHDPALGLSLPPGDPVPPALVAAAPDLLLQDLDTRRSAGVLATLAAAGPGAFWRRITARRSMAGDDHAVARDLGAEGGFAGWAGNRLRRTIGELASPAVRRQSRDLAALSRWLGR